jgi:outer membrane immunogenic protein
MFAAQGALAAEWTGFYIGVHTGGVFGDIDATNVSDTVPAFNVVPGQVFPHSPDGVLGGAQVGFDWQWANWVFGIDVAGAGMDFDEMRISPYVSTERTAVEMEWVLTASAKLGIAWEDSLFYVKGGYAGGEVRSLHSDPFTPSLDSWQSEEMHNGFIVGAGIAHQIGSHVSFGLEYNYIDLGETDHAAPALFAGTFVNDVDVQLHTVTARLNYHFNPF